MDVFAGLISLVFVVLLVGVAVWVIARVVKSGRGADRVDGLAREIERLQARVELLEKQGAASRQRSEPAGVRQPQDVGPHGAARSADWEDENTLRPRARVVTTTTSPVAMQNPTPASVPMTPAAPLVTPVVASAAIASTSPVADVPVVKAAPAAARVESALPVGPPSTTAPPPYAKPVEPVVAKPHVSLEERLGKNWLNKLGIVILVTGLVLLLGYKLRTLGPAGKSAMGFVFSGAILATGLLLEKKERYRVFARAAIGGGWALLYFVTFGLFHVPAMQVLHSQAIDLVLMLGVASVMVVHSLKYKSQVVTSLAFLLALFTVSISHVTVFSLVASGILATGLVAVAFRERWFVMALGGIVGVYANHFLWLQRVLPDGAQPGHAFPEFLPSAALLIFYWLLFRAFYIFRVPENEKDRVCSTLNVLLNTAGLLTLLKYQSSHPEWAFYGLLVLGVAELGLAFVARRTHKDAFVALACIASVFLLAAVPFRFSGSSWSLLWLLQSELLFIVGLLMRESVFRRLGLLSSFAAFVQLVFTGALPIFNMRQEAPDASHHVVTAVAFGCTALAAWFNAEFAARRWKEQIGDALDRTALQVLSYVGMIAAAVCVWIAVAGAWTPLPWLVVALALAFVADRLESRELAQQADLLNFTVLIRIVLINFAKWYSFNHAMNTTVLLIASALLYANMRRRQRADLLETNAIGSCYAWAAAGVLTSLAWFALQPAMVSVAWCAMGLVLLEIGLAARKGYFRHQAFVLLAMSFVRLYFINVDLANGLRLSTMLPIALVLAWVYERLRAHEETTEIDRKAAAVSAWFALSTVSTLLYFSLRPAWVAVGGAAMTVALLLMALMLKRVIFRAQAVALLLVAAARTLVVNIFAEQVAAVKFTDGRVFTVSLTCALLLSALPIAFALRKQEVNAPGVPSWLRSVLQRPEQVVFFAPLAMIFVLIPVQLRAGMITVGWSALGVVTFLVALVLKERSFRLSGLVVLLVGVAKLLAVDVWQASPTDRYITLIVMGAALLLVSFLYSRYRETILELL